MPDTDEKLLSRQLGVRPEPQLIPAQRTAAPRTADEKLIARRGGLQGLVATSLTPGEVREQGQREAQEKTAALTRRDLALAGKLGQTGVGQQELTFAERFDLGMSDIFEEKKAKFPDKFPDVHFEMIPTTMVDERGLMQSVIE